MRSKIIKKWRVLKLIIIVNFVLQSNPLQAKETPFSSAGPSVINISDINGINLGKVTKVFQSDDGFLWILSAQLGLVRYNGTDLKQFDSPSGLGNINTAIEDSFERIWLGFQGGEIRVFDKHQEVFHTISEMYGIEQKNKELITSIVDMIQVNQEIWLLTQNKLSKISLLTGELQSIDKFNSVAIPAGTVMVKIIKSKHGTWLATSTKGVFLFTENGMKHFQHEPDNIHSINHNYISDVKEGVDGNIWLGTANGLAKFNQNTQDFTRLYPAGQNAEKYHNVISSIIDINDRELWIGTYIGGLFRLNKETLSFEKFLSEDKYTDTLPTNQINYLFKASDNNLWIATTKGISFIPERFRNLSRFILNNDTNCEVANLTPLDKDSLYFACGSGLYNFDITNQYVTHLTDFDSNIWSIALLNIKNEVLITTKSGDIFKVGAKGKVLKDYFAHKPNKGSYAPVFDLEKNDNGNIFGIQIFNTDNNLEGGVLKYSALRDNISFHSYGNPIRAILPLSNGKLLVAEEVTKKLFILNTESMTSIQELDSKYDIISLAKSDDGKIWVGTKGSGIFELNIDDNAFTPLFIDSEQIYTFQDFQIGNDNNHWFADNLNLYTFNSSTNTPICISCKLGFPQISMMSGSSLHLTKQNILFVGSTNKLYSFQVELVANQSRYSPSISITELKLFNKTVTHKMSETPLDRAIEYTDSLTFDYTDYLFSLSFAALDFLESDRRKYAYKLEGLDEKWIQTDSRNRVATYTTLPYGNYKFRVKTLPNNLQETSQEASLAILIQPPPWLSFQAYAIYFIVLMFSIYTFIRYRTNSLRKKAKALEIGVHQRTLELKEKSEKIESLLLEKNRLFSNVSHEFRTPLTLILTSAEDIKSEEYNDSANSIIRNSVRLLQMVEKLLDFSSINEKNKIQRYNYDVLETTRSVFATFESLFKKYSITSCIKCPPNIYISFEEDGFEKILVNLISNAVKFSPINSIITCSVTTEKNLVSIAVSDCGPGININEREKVFERFYRSPLVASNKLAGSGIGLSLVAELVSRNRGRIIIDDNYPQGCKVIVSIPLVKSYGNEKLSEPSYSSIGHAESNYLLQITKSNEEAVKSNEHFNFSKTQSEKANLILVIEDNIELQNFIAETLSSHYKCIKASNGNSGLIAAREHVPDLIVSDVMMSGLDGFEVLSTLKNDPITCHVPIIMLTALGDLANRIKGFEALADDYLTKPFQRQELQARIGSLLSNRKILRKYFSSDLGELGDDKLALLPEKDRTFISRFEEIIESRYSSSSLTRQTVSDLLFMSERQLNRKLSALLDHNFSEFVRKYRLTKSLEFINKGLQVTQISEKVGFSNLAYFSSCFKEEFGVSIKKYEQLIESGEVVKGNKVKR